MRTRAVVLVLIHTGMRIEEFSLLVWGRVDLTRGGSSVTVEGKGGKMCVVELDREGRAAFLALWKLIEGMTSWGPTTSGRSIRCSSRPAPRARVSRCASRASRRCSGLTPGCSASRRSRRTCSATRSPSTTGSRGDDITLIQAWMGHARLETTGIYLAVGPQERRKAMDRFAGLAGIHQARHSRSMASWSGSFELISACGQWGCAGSRVNSRLGSSLMVQCLPSSFASSPRAIASMVS